jgi:hypothetical protein
MAWGFGDPGAWPWALLEILGEALIVKVVDGMDPALIVRGAWRPDGALMIKVVDGVDPGGLGALIVKVP